MEQNKYRVEMNKIKINYYNNKKLQFKISTQAFLITKATKSVSTNIKIRPINIYFEFFPFKKCCRFCINSIINF